MKSDEGTNLGRGQGGSGQVNHGSTEVRNGGGEGAGNSRTTDVASSSPRLSLMGIEAM